MTDSMSAEVAWRRAAAAAEEASLAFDRANALVRQNAAWLAIAVAWQRAALYATAAAEAGAAAAVAAAAAAAEAEAASDGGPTESDLRGEVNHGD